MSVTACPSRQIEDVKRTDLDVVPQRLGIRRRQWLAAAAVVVVTRPPRRRGGLAS